MMANQFREALAALDLSQVGAATLFGVNDRTARRWASGEQNIPRAVALALLLMAKHRIKPEKAESMLVALANA